MPYRLYGLNVESDFALPAALVETSTSIDLTIVDGGVRTIPTDPPDGRVLSKINVDGIHYYSYATEDGFLIRYPRICEVVVDRDLTTAKVFIASVDKRPTAELLVAANLFAQLLTIRGDCVLHASAVEKDGLALAFVGAPGTGKSTIAAVLCAAGARLITDDVLRIVPDDGRLRCALGSTQLRLRGHASELARMIEGDVDQSHDQRTTVAPASPSRDPLLAGIVFGQASRTDTKVGISRLRAADALLRLTMFPRVLGWEDPRVNEQTFRWNSRLAREVPAYVATIPWGPPFAPEVSHDLLALLQPTSR